MACFPKLTDASGGPLMATDLALMGGHLYACVFHSEGESTLGVQGVSSGNGRGCTLYRFSSIWGLRLC
jgi:hypothetical protein